MLDINITNEPHQEMTIPFEDNEIILSIRFYSVIGQWCIDVEYNGEEKTKGNKLSLGVLHLLGLNLPFDFVVFDSFGTGIDPFKLDDFSDGRCSLFMVEREELAEYRGYTVE